MIWLIVVIGILVVLAAVAAVRWNRSAALRRRFGAEYERILAQEGGDQRRVDAALRDRTKRRAALDVRGLPPEVHARYHERWYVVQGRFVDNPRETITEAAGLVRSVLRERGYRATGLGDAGEPDAAADADADSPDAVIYDELDLVAVDHPDAATRFRGAQDAEENGSASTEELRQAFQGYKALFVAVLVSRDVDADADHSDGDAGGEDHRVVDIR